MNECLLELADGTPVWAPRYITINELFKSFLPGWSINDPIDTTLRIVSLFRRLTRRNVSVDWFYGWAERLLADFDDVDKNMADAEQLFRNVNDWKAYDDTSFLSAEQVEELRRFFAEFDPERKTELRENYRQLWDVLYEMYSSLKHDLAERKSTYEGAFFRRVVDGLQDGTLSLNDDVDRYVLVGFNVLDRVEQQMFKFLKKEGKAIFYWDYDEYYTSAYGGDTDAMIAELYNEAGTFMRENLKMFPGELGAELYRNLSQPKEILMISATTEAIQAQYVAPWLNSYLTPDAKQTAVVLCNENLLQPVLHALPEGVGELNVTKGFPLSHTEVVSSVEHQLAEWERNRSKQPIAELLDELSRKVEAEGEAFVSSSNYSAEKFECVLQGEAYFQMYTILNRFARIMADYEDRGEVSLVTLRRLVRGVVRQASIPFHGEPAEGLQIMGVLETRCIDFKHIIMLSVNDGVLPKKANDNSFIPYVLRKAFRLTTPERRTAVYAYYFYRLLQRAEHVTMTYNTSTDGMSTGEMSRFMTQLLVEWPHRVEHFTLNSDQYSAVGSPTGVDKPADLLALLTKPEKRFPSLSPSALIQYLECQLRFYYKYVLHITEPDVDTEEMRPNTFGSIFHKAAENVYKHILKNGGEVTSEYLLDLAKDNNAIHNYVKEAFAEVEVAYRILEAKVLEMYLATLLRRDAELGNFRIVGTERDTCCFVDAEREGEKVTFCIGGQVDRLDFIRDENGQATLRVVDYKTGSANTNTAGVILATTAESVADIFAVGGNKGYMMQTFLYDKMLGYEARNNAELAPYMKYPVTPALFFIRRASKKGYDPRLKVGGEVVTDLAKYSAEFDEHLHALLNEIIDPSLRFEPTEERKSCLSCPYRGICHKQ